MAMRMVVEEKGRPARPRPKRIAVRPATNKLSSIAGAAFALNRQGLSQGDRRSTAAAVIQNTFRMYQKRKARAVRLFRVNLKYELVILQRRKYRRKLLIGFVQREDYICPRAPPTSPRARSQRTAACASCPRTPPTFATLRRVRVHI